MKMDVSVLKSIQDLTSRLIQCSLSVEQCFPSLDNGYLFIANSKDISIALKNVPYDELYSELDQRKCFNIKLIDGGLLQMQYTFVDDCLQKHRLAFFPNPGLCPYEMFADAYEQDLIYGDILSPRRVVTPLRFDYDPSSFDPIHHPKSHLTIGQFQNCRIPVSHPVDPGKFVDFVLRCFYNSIYRASDLELCLEGIFPETIVAVEKRVCYIQVN
jgi:hypothetical protein